MQTYTSPNVYILLLLASAITSVGLHATLQASEGEHKKDFFLGKIPSPQNILDHTSKQMGFKRFKATLLVNQEDPSAPPPFTLFKAVTCMGTAIALVQDNTPSRKVVSARIQLPGYKQPRFMNRSEVYLHTRQIRQVVASVENVSELHANKKYISAATAATIRASGSPRS